MAHRIGTLLVCTLFVVSATVLASLSSVIDSKAVPRSSSQSVQAVRDYYSALNQYMETGQGELVTSYLLSPRVAGSDSAPLPAGELEAIVPLAALRMSYPLLDYRITDIESAGDAVVARIAVDPGPQRLPAWIDAQQSDAVATAPEYFRVEDHLIIESTANAGQLTSFLNLVQPESSFRLDRPARVTIAELVLSARGTSTQFVPLPGPGVFVVQSGSVAVFGDGLVEIVRLRMSDRLLVPPSGDLIAEEGDAIIVSGDSSVVRVDAGNRARLLGATVVPAEAKKDRHFEREHMDGSLGALGLEDVLRERSPGVQTLWFGSVEVLSAATVVLASEWIVLDAGWLVVPPGGRVAVDSRDGEPVLQTESDSVVIDRAQAEDMFTVTNLGAAPTLVFVVRAERAALQEL